MCAVGRKVSKHVVHHAIQNKVWHVYQSLPSLFKIRHVFLKFSK